ncbi:hypothetical protein KQI63_01230 [bacterium]|nr:hypothetical protein [bacterium]
MQGLFWLYLANATLLILHEMDSTYWKEWELFGIRGGVTVFLLLHIPLLAVVLYGLVLLDRDVFAGLILSLIVAITGIGAFLIHSWFLRKDHPQFNTPFSRGLLLIILLMSIAQGSFTIVQLLS